MIKLDSKYYMMLKILASTLCGIVAGSMLIPYLTLKLKITGYPESAIGFWSSLSWIGLLLASPFVAKVNAKFGYRKTYIFTGYISLAYVLLLFFVQNYYVWCLLHFCIGSVWAMRWVTTEAFINAIAPDDKRGKFIGVYGSLIWIALAIGPAILLVTGTNSNLPFYVAIGLFLISFTLNFLVQDVKDVYDPHTKTKLGTFKFFTANKFVFIAAFIGGIFENGVNTPGILYALRIGITPENAPLVAAAIGFGALSIQYPIGWLADKYKSQNHYLLLSFILVAANAILFFAAKQHGLLFISAFMWGVFGPAIYVVLVTWLGGKYRGNDLVAVTSFVIFGYTLGGITAPIASGLAIEYYAIYGFPTLLAFLSVVIFAASVASGRKYRIA